MTTITAPRPGLIGLTSVHGEVGKLIQFGQWLNGDGFGKWQHALISLGDGLVAEAEPGGARIAPAAEYDYVFWCENIGRQCTDAQLLAIAAAARRYTQPGPWGNHGVPYSFLDYASLTARRLHVPAPHLREFIASSEHMICSQLCDQCALDAGVHLYHDNRWAGDVTPMDLFNLETRLERPGATL